MRVRAVFPGSAVWKGFGITLCTMGNHHLLPHPLTHSPVRRITVLPTLKSRHSTIINGRIQEGIARDVKEMSSATQEHTATAIR